MNRVLRLGCVLFIAVAEMGQRYMPSMSQKGPISRNVPRKSASTLLLRMMAKITRSGRPGLH